MGPRAKELKYSLHLVRRSPMVLVGVVIIVALVSIAFLAPWITPYKPEERIWNDSRAAPGSFSSQPKFDSMPIYSQMQSDTEILPNYTRGQLSIQSSELTTGLPPSLVFGIYVVNTSSDKVAVTIHSAVYNLTLTQFDSMNPVDREAFLLVSKADIRLHSHIAALPNSVGTYVWVYWFNATQKTVPWIVNAIIILQYNYWYPVHVWGADENGGDIYSRIIWASQVDLRISITIVLVAIISGSLIGAVAGYFGGKFDEMVMRITDIFFAFPGLILAMAIVMALGQRSLDNIALALMVTWWPVYARLVRGQVLSEREKLYVEAARSIGASDSRILLSHILPNTIQPLIVQGTLDTGGVLLTAAGLAFIGFGPPTGTAEWGLMISTGQQLLLAAPWMSMYPGLAILITALAFNLVGDGIRDILDPKLRRR
jgi:peptide/nickel transport system permease protein